MKGGFIGVDVFFVISGYLISTILFENLKRGTFSFSQFYARRIKRIFPALFVVLAASYAFGWFALLADEYKLLGKHVAAGAGFVSNFVLWSEAGYFDSSAETKPLLHLWSLGVEEQFYIVWPLLLWLAWKQKLNLLTVTAVAAVASFLLNLWGSAAGNFYPSHTRFWELLCGGILAWLTLYRNAALDTLHVKLDGWVTRDVFVNALSFLGLALLIYGFWRINKFSFPGKWAVVPVLGGVLLIAAGPSAWFNRVVLSSGIAVWFGLISFPLYLWHWPLLSFARIVEGEVPSEGIRVAAVALSIVLAWLTYKFVETPVRTGKRGAATVVVPVCAMVVAGSVGYFTFAWEGLVSRFDDKIELRELVSNPLPGVKDFDCARRIPEFAGMTFDGGCRLSKDALPTMVLVGDSHAAQYWSTVSAKFSDEVVLLVSQTSCLPFSGGHFLVKDCKRKHDAVVDFLARSSSVKVVVVAGHWAYLMSGGFGRIAPGLRLAKAPSEAGIRSFSENGGAFLSKVVGSGKRVVVVKDIPDLDFDIRTCFDVRPLRITRMTNHRPDCSMSAEVFTERSAPYDAVVADMLLSVPTVEMYDPRPIFCRDGRCFASDGSLPYYFNGDHVNRVGADLVIGGLVKLLVAKRLGLEK